MEINMIPLRPQKSTINTPSSRHVTVGANNPDSLPLSPLQSFLVIVLHTTPGAPKRTAVASTCSSAVGTRVVATPNSMMGHGGIPATNSATQDLAGARWRLDNPSDSSSEHYTRTLYKKHRKTFQSIAAA